MLECGHGASSVLLSRILLLQSKTVITAHRLCVFVFPILCSAISLNAMHIGDYYRDFPYALRVDSKLKLL